MIVLSQIDKHDTAMYVVSALANNFPDYKVECSAYVESYGRELGIRVVQF